MWTRTETLSDVLSLVLSRAQLESFVTCAFDLGGEWAVEFPCADALRFKFITRGQCWLTVEGDAARCRRINAGDCFLVSAGRSFVLSKTEAFTTTERAEDLARAKGDDCGITYNGGGDTLSIGAVFHFLGHFSKVVLDALPPVIHIPAHLDQAAILRWSLDRFTAEYAGARAGRALMMVNLAPMILLQTLRIHLSETMGERNWLAALSHPKLSRAIEGIHGDCRKQWTLQDLAKVAGMSRASFAVHFKEFVGLTAMDYLASWRMQVACDALREGSLTIADIAGRVGYESESAFSAAFKRTIGVRPGQYQRSDNGMAISTWASPVQTSSRILPSEKPDIS